MMFGNNFSGSFALWNGLSGLLSLAFLIGLIFFVAWAIKNFKKDQLFNWGITLLIIGVIGWLLTASVGGFGHRDFSGYNGGFGMMEPSTFNCMQDEECHEEMEDFMHRMMGFDEHE
jgi:hypothetical protein